MDDGNGSVGVVSLLGSMILHALLATLSLALSCQSVSDVFALLMQYFIQVLDIVVV
jgi:hypothetical protein